MNVYDFDGTIYKGDSTVDFWLYCMRKKKKLILCIPQTVLWAVKYKLGFCSKRIFKEKFYRFLKKIDDTDQIVTEFWKTHECKIKEWYIAQKKETDIVISASPEFLIKPICDRLGIDSICSLVDKNTGTLLGENCYGEEKVIRFKQIYTSSIDRFYSDSYSDAPMAKLADKAYIVKNNMIKEW